MRRLGHHLRSRLDPRIRRHARKIFGVEGAVSVASATKETHQDSPSRERPFATTIRCEALLPVSEPEFPFWFRVRLACNRTPRLFIWSASSGCFALGFTPLGAT